MFIKAVLLAFCLMLLKLSKVVKTLYFVVTQQCTFAVNIITLLVSSTNDIVKPVLNAVVKSISKIAY